MREKNKRYEHSRERTLLLLTPSSHNLRAIFLVGTLSSSSNCCLVEGTACVTSWHKVDPSPSSVRDTLSSLAHVCARPGLLYIKILIYFFIFYFFGSFCLFRAAQVACGGSQARGPIGAVAMAYATATAMQDPSQVCNLHHSA